MSGISWIHWLIVLIFLGAVFPVATILKKAGFSGWWAVLYFVPFANLIGIFLLAYTPWPARKS